MFDVFCPRRTNLCGQHNSKYRRHIRLLLPGGLLAGSKPACWYCVYLVIQKWVFRPTGATQGSDEGEIWHGEADCHDRRQHVKRPSAPLHVTSAQSLAVFRQRLETFMFHRS